MTDTCGGVKVRKKKASVSTHRTSAPQTTTQGSAFILSSKSFYLTAGLLMLTRFVLELPVPCSSAFPEARPVLSLQYCPHQFSSAFLVNTSFFRHLPAPCAWLFLLCVACGLHPDHSPILNWPKHPASLQPKAPGDLCQVHPPTHIRTNLLMISEDWHHGRWLPVGEASEQPRTSSLLDLHRTERGMGGQATRSSFEKTQSR